jgi:hypothetical protein
VFDAYTTCLEHRPGSGDDGDDVVMTVPARVLRVRVALYLRLGRRVEALERGEGWAHYIAERGTVSWGVFCAMFTARPWRPLWLDAPAHDPKVSPRERRHG